MRRRLIAAAVAIAMGGLAAGTPSPAKASVRDCGTFRVTFDDNDYAVPGRIRTVRATGVSCRQARRLLISCVVRADAPDGWRSRWNRDPMELVRGSRRITYRAPRSCGNR